MMNAFTHCRRHWLTWLLLAIWPPSGASADLFEQGDKVHLQLGGYVHFRSSDNYEGPPILGNFELNKKSNWLYGLSLFNNSYGDFSQYLYVGKKWELPQIYKPLHVKLTGGVIHGYTGRWKDKLAFNHNGFAPAIIPSVGLKKGRWATDLILLGDAGLLLTIGYDIVE